MTKSAADRLREKAQRLNAKTSTPAAPVDGGDVVDQAAAAEHHLAQAPSVNVKPVRSTVDLAPVRHAALKSWCGETAVEIGTARVTTQDVMRVLVARLLTDATLAQKIRDDLRKEKAK
jgi:hypothetical protein